MLASAPKWTVRGALFLTLGGFAAFYLYTWLSTMRGGPQRAQAFIVKSLPLATLRWGVVAVVLYTSFDMLRSAAREGRAAG